MSTDLIKRKIFPRNLTARADALVRGNSVATRPESGVENCYPGLEFDQRNLDKRFFPGLVFEFHADLEGCFVRTVEPNAVGEANNFSADDLTAGIFLWALYGNHGREQDGVRTYPLDLSGMGGLQCWRYVHDIEPGPIGLFLGPLRYGQPPFSPTLLAQFEAAASAGQEQLIRDTQGRLRYAILCGERRRYLDAEGVIDPAAFEPGDLTRSLCAPWQYDFRDCGCFYWASNKPDLVAVKPDAPQIANFQRKRGAPEPTAPVRDYRGWVRGEYSYTEMIHDWEALSSVIDCVESDRFALAAPPQLPPGDILPRAEVLRRLRYLATVEHGLMVEYLYANYSLKAEAVRPELEGEAQRLYDARRVVLSVAIDEMRHLRWINEILRELGEPAELGRFTSFEDFDGDQRTLTHDFSLEPLSAQRLDWFIEVESPSQAISVTRDPGTIDGLYTRLLLSIAQGSEFSEIEKARLEHLLKLVIDEGQDHFARFTRVKALLAGMNEPDYLQLPSKPIALPADHVAKMYEKVADQCYALVLETLRYVFETGGAKIGEMLNAARHAMYAFDDAARAVTNAGGAPLFTLPSAPPLVEPLAGAAEDLFFNAKAAVPFGLRIAHDVQSVVETVQGADPAFANALVARYAKLVEAMNATQ